MDVTGNDVFDVLWKSIQVKLGVMAKYPLETRYYIRSFTDTSMPAEVQESIQQDILAAYSAMDIVTENLDKNLLKKGLEKDKVARIVYLVCEGLSREVLAEMPAETSEEFWKSKTEEAKASFDFMRELFYK